MIKLLYTTALALILLITNSFASFPLNQVLDNFNRANSTTTLGTNWTPDPSVFTDHGGVISDLAYNPQGSDGMVAMWTLNSYSISSGTMEAYVTLNVLSTGGIYGGIVFTNARSGTINGYMIGESSSQGIIYKGINTSQTSILTPTISSPHSGDSIGATITSAGVITYWYCPNGGSCGVGGSGWVNKGTVTDTTYTPLYIGILDKSGSTTWRYANFGGGTEVLNQNAFVASGKFVAQGKVLIN